jgi:hypothetical protein
MHISLRFRLVGRIGTYQRLRIFLPRSAWLSSLDVAVFSKRLDGFKMRLAFPALCSQVILRSGFADGF